MIILLVTLASVACVLATFSVLRAFRRAEEGYEDELGFHRGVQRAPAIQVRVRETVCLLSDRPKGRWHRRGNSRQAPSR